MNRFLAVSSENGAWFVPKNGISANLPGWVTVSLSFWARPAWGNGQK